MAGGAGCEYYFGYQFAENDIVCQDGDAGTAFLADTFGLHKGSYAIKNDRLVAWARYGLGVNHSIALNNTTPEKILNKDSLYLHNPYLTRIYKTNPGLVVSLLR